MNKMCFDEVSIDVHGHDRESALVEVNNFIEQAIKAGYKKVTIIHGRGENILKNSIHESLKINKKVNSYELNINNIGETIIRIKN